MFGFIYITVNLVNGKKYLGFCNYNKKIWKTYLGSGKALKRAIRKYGKANFSREIIFEAATKEELSKKEIELIKLYNCVDDPNWYNLAEGGYTTRGFSGKKHSAETRIKMSQNHKQPLTEDSKRRIGDAVKRDKRWLKAQQIVSCRYCNLKSNLGSISRWHNDNCPHKPVIKATIS